MAELATPRAMIRTMLQGEPLPRPLLLPIVFSLGARLENLSLRAFLENPTRIANSQRQIRNVLGLDGVTCYFDPYLEAEASGCALEWSADESSRVLRPVETDPRGLRERLQSPEEIAKRGRIPVACDVLLRLKMMLPGDPVLMAVVTGPCTLAGLLTGNALHTEAARIEGVELAADVTAAVSKSFLEAGANVLFIREVASLITGYRDWAELLAPIVNVVRFYEALPVLLSCDALPEPAMAALKDSCEGLVCPATVELALGKIVPASGGSAAYLPDTCFLPNQQGVGTWSESLRVLLRDAHLSALTSRGDVPAEVDVKHLAGLFGVLRGVSRVA